MKSVYTQETYILPLESDLDQAQSYIGYMAPFLSKTAIDLWQSTIVRAIARGVRVCIFVEQPEYWGYPNLDDDTLEKHQWLQRNITRLMKMGAHVTFVKNFHQKVLIIDYRIEWSGSINFLSSPGKKIEKVDRNDDLFATMNSYFRFNFERCAACEAIQWSEIRGGRVLDIESLQLKNVILESKVPNSDGVRLVPEGTSVISDVNEEPIVQWLAAIRESLNITLLKHCADGQIDKNALLRFETGKTHPRLEFLIRILKALKLKLVIVPEDAAPLILRICKAYNKSDIRRYIEECKKTAEQQKSSANGNANSQNSGNDEKFGEKS